jgi:glycosyltransferase involved in cell wall biosynthesis
MAVIGHQITFVFGSVGLHKRHRYDALWAMMSYMVFPIVLLRLMGVKVPYVLNLQDGDPFERVFGRLFILPFKPLLLYGFRHATVVQTLSHYLAAWAKKAGYRGTIEVIPNGADVKRFIEAQPRDIQRKEGDIWLVTSSRLVHKNAVDDVIRSLAFLTPNIKFLILGVGEEEKALRALVKSQKVEDRVVFQGYVSHADLPGYLKACDIFIRPSRTEGFGASFPEAMAAGLPVIATQEGGIADFLFDAKRNPEKPTTGWAVDKDTPEQIAEAVKEIFNNPEQTKRVIENARELVSKSYDWDLIAKDMKEKVFSRLFKTALQ